MKLVDRVDSADMIRTPCRGFWPRTKRGRNTDKKKTVGALIRVSSVFHPWLLSYWRGSMAEMFAESPRQLFGVVRWVPFALYQCHSARRPQQRETRKITGLTQES